MKMKILCLVISLITLITLTACKPNQTMPPQSEETQNTTPSHNVTTPSDNATTPSVNVTTPSDNVTPPPDNVQDAIITDEFIAACNINSGGYINYLNGKYYYRNTEGDKLFMCDADGKNAVCIDSCTSGETISAIAASETAIYYSKCSRLDPVLVIPTGDTAHTVVIVRQLFQFCDGKITALSEKNVLDYALTKDYIFYTTINSTNADAEIKIYRMKHDGTEKTAIFDLGLPMELAVSEDMVYAQTSERVVSMDFDGKNSSNNQLYAYSLAVNQSAIYFVNTNGGYYLCKTESSEDSTASWLDNQQVVIADKVRAYTVYNGRFVYERISTDEILITDANGANPEVICKGTNPISLNGHLFYLDDNGAIKVADI